LMKRMSWARASVMPLVYGAARFIAERAGEWGNEW
jgi:hypothetical protein